MAVQHIPVFGGTDSASGYIAQKINEGIIRGDMSYEQVFEVLREHDPEHGPRALETQTIFYLSDALETAARSLEDALMLSDQLQSMHLFVELGVVKAALDHVRGKTRSVA